MGVQICEGGGGGPYLLADLDRGSKRRQKISMIFLIAPLTDQISVFSSRCRVPKEMSGHGKGRVKSIPKADRGIGKRVSQILLKMSGKFVQSGFGK